MQYYVAATPINEINDLQAGRCKVARSWLEDDGRRLPMDAADGDYALQVAVDGGEYEAGIFLKGHVRPFFDQALDFALYQVNDEWALRWTSGNVTSLGFMPRMFERRAAKSGYILLHWRDDHDETIQRALLPITLV